MMSSICCPQCPMNLILSQQGGVTFRPRRGEKTNGMGNSTKTAPKVAIIFCCWICFAFRVLDHIPKFRFIDIYTVIIISISTNNSMLPVNKHQKNVSASCFGERKTCCGCKVEFFWSFSCRFLQRERWQDWTCIPSELRRFQGPGWYTSPGYDPKRVDPKMSNVPKIPSPYNSWEWYIWASIPRHPPPPPTPWLWVCIVAH